MARPLDKDKSPPVTPVPTAFRIPCSVCGTDVIFPFDAALSAKLDLLQALEEQLHALCADTEVHP